MTLSYCRPALVYAVLAFTLISQGFAQHASPRARITQAVDDTDRVTSTGNVHPLARAKYDRGAVPDDTPASRMLLLLSRSAEQDAALQQLLEDQQTPGSSQYRKWLTPAEFGEQFGPADADVQAVTSWLAGQGFQVNRVTAGKTIIEFSGNAGQIRQAFHSQMHQYLVAGGQHLANATDPQIPAALAPVVKGIASLNNFERKPSSRLFGVFHRDPATGDVQPEFTVSNGSGTTYYAIGPADFATIYNTNPLRQAGINGSGRTIAVVGVTNVNLQNVTDFRNLFNLGSGNTSVVIDGPDPGIVTQPEFEALLDLEWANAAAPGASVVLVSAQETETTSGVDLAALHVIENNLADVLSVSFGTCEEALGSTENQFIQALWQQAAAQGMTVIVSSGDAGSAGCGDFNNDQVATAGLAVSGVASTPFNVAVGGTDFNDANSFATYWSSTNDTTTWLSAKSYIPEMTWNSSCAATATAANLNVCPAVPTTGTPPSSLNIVAASGGASSCSSSTGSGTSKVCQGTPKPAWQTGAGVPSDGVRDIPDVSLFSAIGTASHSFYVICNQDALPPGSPSCQFNGSSVYFVGAGGTSVAAPAFAGMIAMADQKSGTRLGNVNYLLYSLAAQPGASCGSALSQSSCIFHDVTQGNISVPCAATSPNCSVTSGGATGVLIGANGAPAYVAQAGYDLATGLGSVNGTNLVNGLASAAAGFKATTTALTLNGGTAQVTAKHGDPITVAVNITPTAATGPVSLLGGTGGIDSASLSGGLANWTSRLFPGGNYNVTAHYPGDGTRAASDSNGIAVSITPESSQTFANLVTFDLNGVPQSYTANTASYGSPYILRMDVADASATVSPSQGISSNCSQRITSCPTGSLALTANGAPLDGGSYALNSAGTAEDLHIQLSPGTYNVVASYAGDASYAASSGTNTVTITPAPVTIAAGIVPAGPYQYGDPVQIYGGLTTTSNGAQPGGTITFFDNGVPINPGFIQYTGIPYSPNLKPPYAWYNASATYGFTPVGQHVLTAQYSGDQNYASATSAPFPFSVAQAQPFVNQYGAGPNPSTPLVPVNLVVSYGGYGGASPSGAITFTDNGTALAGTVNYTTNGPRATATMTYTFTQLGSHNLVANYPGDANYAAFAQPLGNLNVVSKLSASVIQFWDYFNPCLVNYPTKMYVLFSPQGYSGPNLTGTVTFFDNGAAITGGNIDYTQSGSILEAVLTYSFPTTGTHNVTVQYNGDAIYDVSLSPQPLVMTVNSKLDASIRQMLPPSGGPLVVNRPTQLTAHVDGNYDGPSISGTVTFLENGSPLDGPVSVYLSGNWLEATLTHTFTTTGAHNITLRYEGDANYSATTSTSPNTVTVEGPVWVNLNQNQGTFSSSGGSTQLWYSVDNNTSTDSPVTVTCVVDLPGATCALTTSSFTVPANGNYYTYLNLTVPALGASQPSPSSFWRHAGGLLFFAVLLGSTIFDRKRKHTLMIASAVLIVALLSCGGGGGGGGSTTPIGGGGTTPPPPPPVSSITYHFTVTATGGGNTATAVYTATVQ